ncbi:Mpv17/PMP22 [Neofusicoccum parvum]|uniref:Mpv17/PMP22 n=2 Tax=Neofusicoccum parvum TaxID=310453 RepID=A0ACB5SIF5_9PEZI|nr:putative mpv17 pmp22 protein [Neofusicoccum parvum UCRNP2]GME42679.1 Mpv17/PMP22 [Neofusicoccum parvum]GME66290.1 Mpv17/PMP22 [Neofusicoccum parvum]
MPSPMVNATLQAAVLSSCSNILAQIIDAYRSSRPLSFNALEFLRFVVLTLITAPPNYLWQQLLERTFPAYPRSASLSHAHRSPRVSTDGDLEKHGDEDGKVYVEEEKPKLDLKNTITKWFVDCITMGAIMNTVAFLVLMGFMKGQSSTQIGNNIRTETIPIIVAGYKIWPIASIISFSFIPVEKRIVFLSAVGLCWGIYMSLVAARV